MLKILRHGSSYLLNHIQQVIHISVDRQQHGKTTHADRGYCDVLVLIGKSGMFSRTIGLVAAQSTIGIRLGKMKVPS